VLGRPGSGYGNDDGVVSGKNDVDENDLQDGEQLIGQRGTFDGRDFSALAILGGLLNAIWDAGPVSARPEPR
jgi:hypothetical protein